MQFRNLLVTAFSALLMSLTISSSANNVIARATGNWSASATWSRALTGTISIANNSSTVTGTGTLFQTEFAVNDVITLADGTVIGTVSAIASNTSLTIAVQNSGAKSGGCAKQAIPQSGDAVTIGNAVTVTLDGNQSISSLAMAAPSGNGTSQLNMGAFTLNVSGNLTMTGGSNTSRLTKIVFTGAGTLAVSGSVTIGNGGSGNTATIDLTNSGTSVASTLKVGTTLSRNATDGVFTPGTLSTVEFTGNGQSISFTNLTYNNIKVSGTSATLAAAITTGNVIGGIEVAAAGSLSTSNNAIALNVSRTLAVIAGGTLDAGTSQITIGAGGSATIAGTLKSANTTGLVGANCTFIGSPSITWGGTVELNAAGAQPVPTNVSYNNLTVSGGAKTVGGGTLTVGGNFTIDAATTLATNNPIVNVTGNIAGSATLTRGTALMTIGGSWTNSGTFPSGLNASFGGTGTIPAQTYGALTFTGSRSLGGDVTANTSVTASNSAKVSLGAFTLTAPSISGNSSSYFVTNGAGGLKISGTGSATFPVGPTSGIYTPVTINGTNTDWTVRVQNSFSGYASTNMSTALPAVWHITPAAAATASVDFQFDQSQVGYSAPATIDVYHYGIPSPNPNNVGAGWYLATNGNDVTVNNLGGNLRGFTMATQSQFSPFAASGNASPLPVQLLSFSGRKQASGAQLNWVTASESMNSGFDVQRSVDGTNFTSIGFVTSLAAGGNSARTLSYSFSDNAPIAGRVYYRLKQVDLDGRARFSQTVVLTAGKGGAISIGSVFPNPVRKGAQISVEVAQAGALSLRIVSINGTELRSWKAAAGAGANTISLGSDNLAAGVYYLQVVDAEGNTASTQFIKQ